MPRSGFEIGATGDLKGCKRFHEEVGGGIDDGGDVVGVGRGAQDVAEDKVVGTDEVEQGDVVREGRPAEFVGSMQGLLVRVAEEGQKGGPVVLGQPVPGVLTVLAAGYAGPRPGDRCGRR